MSVEVIDISLAALDKALKLGVRRFLSDGLNPTVVLSVLVFTYLKLFRKAP